MKRVIGVIAALVLVAGLGACRSGDAPATGSATASPAQPTVDASGLLPGNSENKAELLHVTGDYIHKPTGLILPARAGDLVRVNVAEYDDEHDDVSANYVLQGAESRMLITAYVFPVWNMMTERITLQDVPRACQSDYETARQQMVDRLTTPSLVNEGPLPDVRFKDAIVNRQAIYGAERSSIGPWAPLTTALYYHCGIGKVWIVQYRITYARDFDAAPIIRQFLASVPSRTSL
jgi:hypothetical protein